MMWVPLTDTFKTPSPGAYNPEKVHPQGEKYAPAYSMGARTQYRKSKFAFTPLYVQLLLTSWHLLMLALCFHAGDHFPSPNSYTLPSLIGSKVPNKQASASYSMASRPITGNFAEDLAKTPGPGRYNAIPPNMYTKKQPAYSMLGRSYMPGGEN